MDEDEARIIHRQVRVHCPVGNSASSCIQRIRNEINNTLLGSATAVKRYSIKDIPARKVRIRATGTVSRGGEKDGTYLFINRYFEKGGDYLIRSIIKKYRSRKINWKTRKNSEPTSR